MNRKSIQIIYNGNVKTAQLIIDGDILVFQYNDENIIATDKVPFIALKILRKQLERDGILLCLEGCRLDVYPSGMQLDMHSSSAYIHLIEKTGGTLVNIFDSTNEIHLVTSIKNQEAYHKNWITSIRNLDAPLP